MKDCIANQTLLQTLWEEFSANIMKVEQHIAKKCIGRYKQQVQALLKERKSVITNQDS